MKGKKKIIHTSFLCVLDHLVTELGHSSSDVLRRRLKVRQNFRMQSFIVWGEDILVYAL